MLKYKGIELREEDVNEKGVELLICIENKSNLDDEEFIENIWRAITPKIYNPFYTYVEYCDEKFFEVRSNGFKFDKFGVDKLKATYSLLKKDLKDAEINIGIYTGDFLFGNGEYNQDEVSLEEFERNIEFVD